MHFLYGRQQSAVDHLNSRIQESLTAIRAIKAFVRGDYENEQFNAVKRELLVNANQVIDDQMRTAQEIANRLGETTAATKITLLKLIQEFEREKELT